MDAIDGRNGNSSEPARMAEQELLCRASPLACKPIFVVWYVPLSACEAWQPCHHPVQEHGQTDNKQEYEHSVLIARNPCVRVILRVEMDGHIVRQIPATGHHEDGACDEQS